MEDLKKFLDPKYPLLQKLRDLAPGTFKHSQNVASLCESIGLALKKDVDLLNVVGFYHDIGKISQPNAFSENQNGENIHDNLEPEISYVYITKHISDGVLYLIQIEDMPRKVIEIISQHHGSTVLKYFFNKSKTKDDNPYRYKGEPPQTIEAAILMICDSVEATARSLSLNGKLNSTEEKRAVVTTTINGLIDDSQLDEMKVGDIKIIKKALRNEIENLYHNRIDYEEDDKDDKDEKIKL